MKTLSLPTQTCQQNGKSGKKTRMQQIKMVVNAELTQWAAYNLFGKGYVLYASDDQLPKTWMCSPGIPF